MTMYHKQEESGHGSIRQNSEEIRPRWIRLSSRRELAMHGIDLCRTRNTGAVRQIGQNEGGEIGDRAQFPAHE